MKLTIEDDNGFIDVFEGIIYESNIEACFTDTSLCGEKENLKRNGSGELMIRMRFHNGVRD